MSVVQVCTVCWLRWGCVGLAGECCAKLSVNVLYLCIHETRWICAKCWVCKERIYISRGQTGLNTTNIRHVVFGCVG